MSKTHDEVRAVLRREEGSGVKRAVIVLAFIALTVAMTPAFISLFRLASAYRDFNAAKVSYMKKQIEVMRLRGEVGR